MRFQSLDPSGDLLRAEEAMEDLEDERDRLDRVKDQAGEEICLSEFRTRAEREAH